MDSVVVSDCSGKTHASCDDVAVKSIVVLSFAMTSWTAITEGDVSAAWGWPALMDDLSPDSSL